jgi:hypothetical protein
LDVHNRRLVVARTQEGLVLAQELKLGPATGSEPVAVAEELEDDLAALVWLQAVCAAADETLLAVRRDIPKPRGDLSQSPWLLIFAVTVGRPISVKPSLGGPMYTAVPAARSLATVLHAPVPFVKMGPSVFPPTGSN